MEHGGAGEQMLPGDPATLGYVDGDNYITIIPNYPQL